MFQEFSSKVRFFAADVEKSIHLATLYQYFKHGYGKVNCFAEILAVPVLISY